jgi:hypothetical protein
MPPLLKIWATQFEIGKHGGGSKAGQDLLFGWGKRTGAART